MNNLVAALIFFTRLPFSRIIEVPAKYYKNVIHFWVYIGIFTSAIMAAVLWCASNFLSPGAAVILAISARLLLTGALHEDGLADFFDGFGGGKDKERILTIMKDSHIGSYGVIALVIYFLLLCNILIPLPLPLAICTILTGDPLCKFISSLITLRLPYVRKESESKSGVIYSKGTLIHVIIGAATVIILVISLLDIHFYPAILAPVLIFFVLTAFMKRKIGGYTGDCCGALFLLTELSYYLIILLIFNIYGNISGQAHIC